MSAVEHGPVFFPCQVLDCGREFDTEVGLYRHVRMTHEKTWKVSGNRKPRKQQAVEVITRTPLPPPKPRQQLFKQVDGFVLLEDVDGGLWIAERIR